ncbi:MAG TPA: hypothetical protein VFN21_10575 [Acidimicrobiales bacterium]|nr:hypothetical protein [Acidimicrobiales bacterium]
MTNRSTSGGRGRPTSSLTLHSINGRAAAIRMIDAATRRDRNPAINAATSETVTTTLVDPRNETCRATSTLSEVRVATAARVIGASQKSNSNRAPIARSTNTTPPTGTIQRWL